MRVQAAKGWSACRTRVRRIRLSSVAKRSRWSAPGARVSEVAAALGMTEQSLRTWVRQEALNRHERDDGLTSSKREELRALRRENARFKQERDLLKRAAAFFAAETDRR